MCSSEIQKVSLFTSLIPTTVTTLKSEQNATYAFNRTPTHHETIENVFRTDVRNGHVHVYIR